MRKFRLHEILCTTYFQIRKQSPRMGKELKRQILRKVIFRELEVDDALLRSHKI